VPLVSVVIPVYNPDGNLKLALQSVQQQTFQNFEVLLIDDGSTEFDQTNLLPQGLEAQVLRQSNSGQAVARNKGIEKSQGRYIAFLDQDDAWKPGKLEKQVSLMEAQPAVALCYTNFETVDGKGKCIQPASYATPISTFEDLLRGPCPLPSAVMVRRSILDKTGCFTKELRTSGDYDLWLKIARVSALSYIKSVEMTYRRHGENLSNNIELCAKEGLSILNKHLQEALRANAMSTVQAAKEGMGNYKSHIARLAFEQARQGFKAHRILQPLRDMASAMRFDAKYTSATSFKYVAKQLRVR